MAKKKAKKKNKYSRKPATLMTQGLKATKEILGVAEQAVKSGKRAMYKGKITKAEKDLLAMKSVTDPADKIAIKAAKTAKGKKAVLESKASQNAIIRNTKNVGKRASKESQKKFNEKAMKAQKSQDAQKIKDKNQVTKSKILAARKKRSDGPAIPPVIKNYVRKGDVPPARKKKVSSPAINERRLPDTDSKNLKPITGKNIKAKDGKPPVIAVKPKGKITKVSKKKMSTGKKAAIGAGVGAAAILANSKRKKDARESKSQAAIITPKAKDKVNSKATGQVKTPKQAQIKSSRNEFNKKVKPEGKKVEKSGSLESVASKVFKGKTIAPKKKTQAMAAARRHIAAKKKAGVPWEKILESLTMLLSSHILSKGISKRYK